MKNYPIILLTLLLSPQICFAPIFGSFSDFETMMNRSGVIAVVWIFQQKTVAPRGGYEEFEVLFRHMLKGEKPSEKSVTLLLRNLPFGERQNAHFAPGQNQLLFLEKSGNDRVHLRNINSSGSHWEVAPYPDFKDIEELSVKQAIRYLLHESVKNKRKELAEFETDVKKALTK